VAALSLLLVDVSLQRVGTDEEPIFDGFILRGNVAASVMSGVSRTKCQVKHSQTLFSHRAKAAKRASPPDRSNSLQPEANDYFIFSRVLASRHIAR
jgi:hypothetical protein